MPPHRALMLGAGAMASGWMRRYVPLFRERVEIAGLVDLDRAALATFGDLLGLPEAARFSDMAAAFERVEADCCFIVLPPAVHREAVRHAVSRRLPILSEKPIADSWEACADIYRAVSGAGLKMQVVQNYRFNAPMLTMRRLLRGGGLGRINYLVARFAADYRQPNSFPIGLKLFVFAVSDLPHLERNLNQFANNSEFQFAKMRFYLDALALTAVGFAGVAFPFVAWLAARLARPTASSLRP